eukprot:jgi/Astpho2/9204/Aster-07162
MKLDEQKKVIMPAIGRAQEMEKAGNAKIAYYCYLYAVIKGMDMKDRHPKIDGIVKSLIEKLEQMRQVVQPDKEADAAIVEDFALRLFTEADRVDRAGRANKLTAHKFYAACNFLEILTQFSPDGTLEPDLLEKQRYALWKSTEINKAIREGRAPTAGPVPKPDPLADFPPASSAKLHGTAGPVLMPDPLVAFPSGNNSINKTARDAERHAQQQPSPPQQRAGPDAEQAELDEMAARVEAWGDSAPPGAEAGPRGVGAHRQRLNFPSTLAQTEAQKFAKYAVSSLSFDDVSSAVKYLNDALKLLTDPSAQPKGR